MELVDLISAATRVSQLAVFPVSASVVVLICARLYMYITGKIVTHATESAAAAFAFGFLAISIGILMSASREPAVTQIIPVALTFVGGIALYLVTGDKGQTSVVLSAVSSFAALLIAGSYLGYAERTNAESFIANRQYDLARQTALAELEFQINTQRRARGLNPINFD